LALPEHLCFSSRDVLTSGSKDQELNSFARQVPEAERDTVRAYRLLVEREPTGTTCNICSGRPTRLRRIADLLNLWRERVLR
jgi:hypothetical protein